MRLPSVTITAALGILATALSACADKPAGDALFPLAEGHRWTYRVTTLVDEDGSVSQQTLTLSNRGAEDFDGAPAWRRRSDSGTDYWLRSDATGIYRVATRSPLDAAPKADAEPRYVLRQPLAVGTEWQATTQSYVLERKNELPHALRHVIKPVPMTYRVAALAETVATPAGRFEQCVRVAGQALVRLFDETQRQFREIPLDTTEWYCPGVGLVRVQRKETAPSRLMTGGTLTMELTAWQ